jgi:UDP-glucose 4-epimerase
VRPASAWVLGAGGLLGSSVVRLLPRLLPGVGLWAPPGRFPWTDAPALDETLKAAAGAYLESLPPDSPWMVLWCAGAGVVGTPAEALDRETRALEALLDGIEAAAKGRPGCFFLSSSAGGLYGGNREIPVTEESAPRPISDYGRNKLRQEELLSAWAGARPRVSVLIGRISNLYGPDQNLSKPQGIIAHLSRCLLHHVPAHVYAPLDTLRDYLYAPDAAAQILAGMERLGVAAPPLRVTKIIASRQTASIGELLAVFSRIAKRQPRIVCGAVPSGALQPSRLTLKSTVWTDLPLPPPTPLGAGIQSVYREHLRLLQASRLPLPASAGR